MAGINLVRRRPRLNIIKDYYKVDLDVENHVENQVAEHAFSTYRISPFAFDVPKFRDARNSSQGCLNCYLVRFPGSAEGQVGGERAIGRAFQHFMLRCSPGLTRSAGGERT